jgi:peptidoglycan/xylan/chitin deacetylase (PgdA/CDA1 family)
VNPPGGLMPSQVPQFVMFGSDDNYYADGVNWLVDTAFAGKKNADGTPAQITFFITAGGGTSQNGGVFAAGTMGQTEQDVVNSWKHAYAAGHEIGNHTWDHMSNNGYTLAQWQTEVSLSQDFLTSQVGIPACELDNWRFPFLEFDDAGFQAYQAAGFIIDTSVEFGYNWWMPPGVTMGFGNSSPESGKHYYWPFTLDSGFPTDPNSGFDSTLTKGVGAHAGVWEFLENAINAPDPSSSTTVHTITGLDYNMWVARVGTLPWLDFCQALQYTFLQKYNGNRSPFNFGIHSGIYSPDDPTQDMSFNNTANDRRMGLQCFIDFLFSGQYPDVRVVGFHKVVEWLRNPQAIH